MESTEREIDELEDPENWDLDTAQIQPPVKNPQAVISVAFTRDELDQVAFATRQRGVSLTAFVKNASMDASSTARAGSHNRANAGNGININDSQPVQSHARLKD